MIDRLNIFSCGGGTQSIAIAKLIIDGKLPKPDLACIVDTGYEKSTTWSYYSFLKKELAKIGVDLVRVSSKDYATYGLWAKEVGSVPIMPVYTTGGGRTRFLQFKMES